jgi:pyruvate kinase
VLKERGATQGSCAIMLDTKGPEIRTTKLKDHKPVPLKVGQQVTVHADINYVGTSSKLVYILINDKVTRILLELITQI